MTESLDEVQAKKSALLFLCGINADSREVERFLMRYPEALLFEGAEADESAKRVVEDQMRRCRCFVSVCNANRRKLLILLKKGFRYYRGVMFIHSLETDSFLHRVSRGTNWDFFADQLKSLEKDKREIQQRETIVKARIERAHSDVKEYQQELERTSRKEAVGRTPLALLKCQRNAGTFEKRSHLEKKLGGITMGMASLEREYELVCQEKKAAGQLQTALLKTAFAGCERHMCDATRRDFE